MLVDQTGHALIADFGMLTIVPDAASVAASNTFLQGGTYRWTSPELFYPEEFGLTECRPTESSDCYALGMVVYEVLSGKVPFYCYRDLVVVAKVLDGERPRRPRGLGGGWFRDDIWNLLQGCWMPEPDHRPRVEVVLQCLEAATAGTLPSPLMIADPAMVDPPTQDLDPGHKKNEDVNQVSLSRQAEPQPLRVPLSEGKEDTKILIYPWSNAFIATFSDFMGRKDIGIDAEHPGGSILRGSAVDQDRVGSTCSQILVLDCDLLSVRLHLPTDPLERPHSDDESLVVVNRTYPNSTHLQVERCW